MANKDGSIPLHLALSHNASETLVRTLITAWPDSVLQKTAEGSIPVHIVRGAKYVKSRPLIDAPTPFGAPHQCHLEVAHSAMQFMLTCACTIIMALNNEGTGKQRRSGRARASADRGLASRHYPTGIYSTERTLVLRHAHTTSALSIR